MFSKLIASAAAFALLTCSLFADEGSVGRVDTENRTITVKIGEKEHDAQADQVQLLDKDGNPAVLADFSAGSRVDVTLENGEITRIQLL